MKHIEVEEAPQYEIQVQDKTYVTVKCLSDHAANTIAGRATRVWEAYEKGQEKGVTFALKDLWMSMQAQQEGDILNTVFKLMADFKSPPDALDLGDYRKYFLTHLSHGLVMLPGGVVDDTKMAMHQETLPDKLNYYHTSASENTARPSGSLHNSRSTGGLPHPTFVPHKKARRIKHLRHYRIVFKEIGKPLHQLHTPELAYRALLDAAKGEEYW